MKLMFQKAYNVKCGIKVNDNKKARDKMLDLDKLKEELLQKEDNIFVGCGTILASGEVCGMFSYLCYKCNHGDGEDARLSEHLKIKHTKSKQIIRN